MRRPIRWGLLILIPLSLVAVLGRQFWSEHEFSRNYKELTLGMSYSDVIQVMRSEPRYRFSCGAMSIAYFASPSIFCMPISDENEGDSRRVTSPKELPDAYGYVQLAFDNHKKMYAYTWIGETSTVTSVIGVAKGSHLSDLNRLEAGWFR